VTLDLWIFLRQNFQPQAEYMAATVVTLNIVIIQTTNTTKHSLYLVENK